MHSGAPSRRNLRQRVRSSSTESVAEVRAPAGRNRHRHRQRRRIQQGLNWPFTFSKRVKASPSARHRRELKDRCSIVGRPRPRAFPILCRSRRRLVRQTLAIAFVCNGPILIPASSRSGATHRHLRLASPRRKAKAPVPRRLPPVVARRAAAGAKVEHYKRRGFSDALADACTGIQRAVVDPALYVQMTTPPAYIRADGRR